MLDVLLAGGGPAGSIAALILARAGARVLVIDRDTFPRDKLCGDTLNPGALALLASLGLTGGPLEAARPLRGMLVSGLRTQVRTEYGGGAVGRAITRRALDAWLLEHAMRAGARFEAGLIARAALLDERAGRPFVRGLVLARRGRPTESLRMPASLTIAADGRRSQVALGLGLIGHPRRPRRWAFGVYASGVRGTSDVGEMHVRSGYYLGIAPLTDSICNVCLVTGPRPSGGRPLDVIRRAITRDPVLIERFTGVEFERDVRVLGPLAVEARAAGVAGLLLAGDAAGFIDPMTGDGLTLAIRGAMLAADEALRSLQAGDVSVAAERLATTRHATLGAKLRFNRALRLLVSSRMAMEVAGVGAAVAPRLFGRVVRYAGDLP